ncbi:MAG TPA: response regulator [Cytophagaceae bacterium]|jgi:response regulator RpfG family c-di-GMP phosphodiesterase|nr:response regulator [Cytophagaceae bacterium]
MELNKSVVCLIDDDEVYQFIFRRQVEISNLASQILIFPNGQKGFDYLKNALKDPGSLPKYIFLDINMPIMDGWQFLEEFSAIKNELTEDIHIYLVTSSIDERDIEKANKISDVKEYLIKPISEHKILQVFEKLT